MPTQLSFNFEEAMPLELYDKDILPETYLIFRSGGKHPFYGVPDTYPIYQELIWPYIKRINYPENRQLSKGAEQAYPCLRDMGSPYPSVTLAAKGKRLMNRKGRRPAEIQATKFFTVHRLVAMAFVFRPPGKNHVMHLNDDATNYLPSNLKWGTNAENHMKRNKDSDLTMADHYRNLNALGKLKG